MGLVLGNAIDEIVQRPRDGLAFRREFAMRLGTTWFVWDQEHSRAILRRMEERPDPHEWGEVEIPASCRGKPIVALRRFDATYPDVQVAVELEGYLFITIGYEYMPWFDGSVATVDFYDPSDPEYDEMCSEAKRVPAIDEQEMLAADDGTVG